MAPTQGDPRETGSEGGQPPDRSTGGEPAPGGVTDADAKGAGRASPGGMNPGEPGPGGGGGDVGAADLGGDADIGGGGGEENPLRTQTAGGEDSAGP